VTTFKTHLYIPDPTEAEQQQLLIIQDPIERALAYAPAQGTDERLIYNAHINQFLYTVASRTRREGWGRRQLKIFIMPMYLSPTFEEQFHDFLDGRDIPRIYPE